MTIVTSSEAINVPAPFALACLNGFLKRRDGPATRARLHLHTPLVPDRTVVACVSQIPHVSPNGAQGRAIAITWEGEGAGPHPTFSGTLAIVRSDRSAQSMLVISGSYWPPLGTAGDPFRGASGTQIARATAGDLLRRLRRRIEAEYSVTKQTA
jgi:hypothetical protein